MIALKNGVVLPKGTLNYSNKVIAYRPLGKDINAFTTSVNVILNTIQNRNVVYAVIQQTD